MLQFHLIVFHPYRPLRSFLSQYQVRDPSPWPRMRRLDSGWVVAAGLDGECGSPHSGGLGDASQALDAQDIVRVGVGCSAALHACAGAPSPKNWLLRTSLIAALALQIALAALQLVSEEVLERNSEGWATMMADVQR